MPEMTISFKDKEDKHSHKYEDVGGEVFMRSSQLWTQGDLDCLTHNDFEEYTDMALEQLGKEKEYDSLTQEVKEIEIEIKNLGKSTQNTISIDGDESEKNKLADKLSYKLKKRAEIALQILEYCDKYSLTEKYTEIAINTNVSDALNITEMDAK